MPERDLLAELAAQEAALRFDHFDEATAWELGVALREAALRCRAARCDLDPTQRPPAVPCRASRIVGPTTTDGSTASAPSSTATAARRSEWESSSASPEDLFDADSRLDPSLFAAHGGAFPILVRGTGCVGTVAVSGLPQLEDHQLVVDTLHSLLASPHSS